MTIFFFQNHLFIIIFYFSKNKIAKKNWFKFL
jgi:hypothetical protein